MRAILDHCGAVPLEDMAGGSVILEEGQNTGRVYVLVEGRIEVLRGGTEVTVLERAGFACRRNVGPARRALPGR